jgi:hypothetical protein
MSHEFQLPIFFMDEKFMSIKLSDATSWNLQNYFKIVMKQGT